MPVLPRTCFFQTLVSAGVEFQWHECVSDLSEGDPSLDFSQEYIEYWQKTDNFRIFQKFTESEIFDIVPPRHVMAGGLSIEDVQRRLAQYVSRYIFCSISDSYQASAGFAFG